MKIFDEVPYIRSDGLILRRICREDRDRLAEMTGDDMVYRYLPTFLFEKRYADTELVIERMYDECFAQHESVLLGIEPCGEGFCGIAEIYGVDDRIHKVSIGYRLLRR